MKLSNLFFVLSFIAVIIIVVNVGTLTDSILVASLFTNFLAIYTNIIKIDKNEQENLSSDKSSPIIPTSATISGYKDYLGDYDKWASERATYENTAVIPTAPDAISTSGIDLANTVMARGRSRDKNCLDGAITKTADYFKYHYGNDFVESENKPWWGRSDY